MPNNDTQALEVHLPQKLIQQARDKESRSTATIDFVVKKALEHWTEETVSTVLYLEKLLPWTEGPAVNKPHPLDFARDALGLGWIQITDFNYSNPIVILAACVPGITPRTAIERRALQDGYVQINGEWVKDNEK